MQTHYERLGLSPKATPAEIRSAYRRLALEHHPDRSKAANATERFAAIAEAYRILGDAERKREYDVGLTLQHEREQRAAARAEVRATSAQPARSPIASELTRLASLFSRGRFHEAEALAHAVLERSPREAVAYAILGDISRARGELNHAANMYAHAVQMDSRNPLYQQRYEELLGRAAPGAAAARGSQASVTAAGSGFLVAACSCFYLALAHEKPMLPGVGPVSTFTLGAVVMLFLTGVAIGAAFLVGGLLDRFSSVSFSSQGRVSPTFALATIALVSFWASAAIYAALGLSQRTLNVSVTRLMGGTVAALFLATMASLVSPTLHPGQMFLWGGNLIYIGGVCGWMTADALRR